MVDLLKSLLSIEDDLITDRYQEVLLNRDIGIAKLISEQQPGGSSGNENDWSRRSLFAKWISLVQELFFDVPQFPKMLLQFADKDPKCKFLKGNLRLRKGENHCFARELLLTRCFVDTMLTENDEHLLKSCAIRVSGAGVSAVDGDYHFVKLMQGSGLFKRQGLLSGDHPVTFYLYKCAVGAGGSGAGGMHHWYISVAPDGAEPGTAQDVDFYYALCDGSEINGNRLLPPERWHVPSQHHHHYNNPMNPPPTRAPAPTVMLVERDSASLVEENNNNHNNSASSARVKVVLPPPPPGSSFQITSPQRPGVGVGHHHGSNRNKGSSTHSNGNSSDAGAGPGSGRSIDSRDSRDSRDSSEHGVSGTPVVLADTTDDSDTTSYGVSNRI
jgi:hypothetical protein